MLGITSLTEKYFFVSFVLFVDNA